MNKIKKIIESKTFRIFEHILSLIFLGWVIKNFIQSPENIWVNIGYLLIAVLAIIININKKKIQNWLEKKIQIMLINKNI